MCATESFLSSYLCYDQDLWTSVSFFFDVEKKLCSVAPPHVCPLNLPLLVLMFVAWLVLLPQMVSLPQQGQTRCLSHLEASPHVLSLTVTRPCLYPACLLPVPAMMICLWEPAQDPNPQEGAFLLWMPSTLICVCPLLASTVPLLWSFLWPSCLYIEIEHHVSFLSSLGWIGLFSEHCSTNVEWMRRWTARVSAYLPMELRRERESWTQLKPCTPVALRVCPGVFPSYEPA